MLWIFTVTLLPGARQGEPRAPLTSAHDLLLAPLLLLVCRSPTLAPPRARVRVRGAAVAYGAWAVAVDPLAVDGYLTLTQMLAYLLGMGLMLKASYPENFGKSSCGCC